MSGHRGGLQEVRPHRVWRWRSRARFASTRRWKSARPTESVTVTEATPLLKTEGGEVSHNVSTQTLNDLPILTLTGAAAGIGTREQLWATSGTRCPRSQLLPGARITTDTSLRINGMPSNSQSIHIEGQDATNGFFKQQNQINQAGVDAIQEVAVQTSNFAAEYGQAGGGYFNYTMKSGTNQFHGSAYDYFVNEALNAGMPFTDAGAHEPRTRPGSTSATRCARTITASRSAGRSSFPRSTTATTRPSSSSTSSSSANPPSISNTVGIVPTAAQRTGDFSAALTASTWQRSPIRVGPAAFACQSRSSIRLAHIER